MFTMLILIWVILEFLVLFALLPLFKPIGLSFSLEPRNAYTLVIPLVPRVSYFLICILEKYLCLDMLFSMRLFFLIMTIHLLSLLIMFSHSIYLLLTSILMLSILLQSFLHGRASHSAPPTPWLHSPPPWHCQQPRQPPRVLRCQQPHSLPPPHMAAPRCPNHFYPPNWISYYSHWGSLWRSKDNCSSFWKFLLARPSWWCGHLRVQLFWLSIHQIRSEEVCRSPMSTSSSPSSLGGPILGFYPWVAWV